ncbi:N-6 DNA methylase [Micromonospora chersina]|uniref:N-6 DNA methylase n=1 Tax=Micromonospora chersina TaxID=47854 RepID=UPI00378EEBFB
MTDSSQTLTLTDIANLAGVGVSAASNWRKRHTDFPRPTVVSGQELFARDEVARWLSGRKIARNGLRPGEAPGTTYGDRFVRNGGAPVPRGHAESLHISAELRSDWATKLWRIMDLLRGDLEIVTAVDFIMGMLYLRVTDPKLWHVVTEQRSWGGVNGLLRDAPLLDHDVPLFPTVVSDLAGGHQLVEAIRLFDEIDLDGVGSASIFDALLENINRDLGRRGGHFTPPSVVTCMLEVLDPTSTDTVYDPSCGSGELLAAAAQHGVESLFGQAANVRSLRMSLLNLSMHHTEAELRIGGPEIMRGAFAADQFDIILSNPPFNVTLPDDFERDAWPFEVPTKHNANFAWLQLAVHKLKPGGRAGVLMPNGTLFTGGVNAEIRRKMIEAGVVEGIIAFPARLFATTGIPVSLWLLRRPEPGAPAPSGVLFVDAMSMGATNERFQRVLHDHEVAKIVQEFRNWRASSYSGEFGDSMALARPVAIEEIRRNEYDLQPRRYVREEIRSRGLHAETPSARLEFLQRELDALDERARRARRDVDVRLAALHGSIAMKWREVALGDLCDIQAGPGTVDRDRGLAVQGWTPLVLPRNIKRGHLSHDELDTVKPATSAKLVKYSLRPGDIVCPRSGTLGRHGLVREAEGGWLLGPSCMRLRPSGDEVVPEYLVHYLNSPDVHKWITSKSGYSTAIPHISAATLRQLVIPLPSVVVQRDIAATMDAVDSHIEQRERGASTMQSLRDLVFPSLTQPEVEGTSAAD